MTPDISDVLERRLTAAFARRAAATTFHEPDAGRLTTDPGAPSQSWPAGAPGGGRRRPVLAAAAVVVIGAGLFGARLLTTADTHLETVAPATAAGPCGPELPFPFPSGSGFVAQPIAIDPGGSPVEAHLQGVSRWQAGGTTIEARWPSHPPLDPTTPYEVATPSVSEREASPTASGGTTRTATFASSLLGTGSCAALDVTVTAADADTTERTLDRIEIALTGPGGPLAGPARTLVTSSSTADAPPEVDPCVPPAGSGGAVDEVVRTTPGLGPHPTPRDALAHFLPTEPRLPQGDHEEIALPDGSFAYAGRSDGTDTDTVVSLARVVPGAEGWSVEWWEASGC